MEKVGETEEGQLMEKVRWTEEGQPLMGRL